MTAWRGSTCARTVALERRVSLRCPGEKPCPLRCRAQARRRARCSGGSGGAASATGEVTIGNLSAASVLVTADPSRLTTSRSSQIAATVFDRDGNPLSGVPVYFSVSAGGEASFVESGGRPVFTDSSGRAFDVFRTRSTVQGEATVLARAPIGGGAFIEGTVVINSLSRCGSGFSSWSLWPRLHPRAPRSPS